MKDITTKVRDEVWIKIWDGVRARVGNEVYVEVNAKVWFKVFDEVRTGIDQLRIWRLPI